MDIQQNEQVVSPAAANGDAKEQREAGKPMLRNRRRKKER